MISAINPVGFNRTVQFKGIEPTQKPQSEKKSMSKTTKTMLGLGALAAITVGGLLAKKHIDLKAVEKFQKDFIPNFEREYGKIEQVDKNFDIGEILIDAKVMLSKIAQKKQIPETECRAFIQRLNKEGLQEFYKNKNLPENLLGKKDGVLLGIIDKDNKILASKAYVTDELGVCLKEDMFTDGITMIELQ